jgi:hypothetical protein
MSEAENADKKIDQKTAPTATPDSVPVRWNTSGLKSSYCNIANANSTREEVVLNFGVNHSWDRTQTELEIELTHRIVMSPFAAKRLSEILQQLMTEYEHRYGALSKV